MPLHHKTTDKPTMPAWVKPAALALSGIPMLASFIFTQQQWYPATYAINWLADKDGTFSLKLAVALNWALMMVPVLALILIAIPIVAIIRRSRKKRSEATL